MKLAHPILQKPFVWDGSAVNTFVLENPIFYRKLMTALIAQAAGDSGEFVLSVEDEPVPLEKHIEVIGDVLCVDPCENKRILAGIQKELAAIATHEMPGEVMMLYGQIHGLLTDLLLKSHGDFIFDDLNDISSLLKLYNVRPDTTDLTLAERLLLYMELCEKYLRKDLFVFFHLHACFSTVELTDFVKDITYRKLNVLLIESRDVETALSEKKVILDCDLCEL